MEGLSIGRLHCLENSHTVKAVLEVRLLYLPLMADTTYEIRCFIDGRRHLSHKLTKQQARCLHQTAMHLADYLAGAYELETEHMARCVKQLVSMSEKMS